MIDDTQAPVYTLTYAFPGDYTIQCTLTDHDGLSATDQMDVQVLAGRSAFLHATNNQLWSVIVAESISLSFSLFLSLLSLSLSFSLSLSLVQNLGSKALGKRFKSHTDGYARLLASISILYTT